MSVFISFGIFNDVFGDRPAPLIYRQSHVLPHRDDPRGGSFDLALIPAFITRDGRDEGLDENKCWPYLRVSLTASDPDEDTVVLDVDQVRTLRDDLDGWLERVDPELKQVAPM